MSVTSSVNVTVVQTFTSVAVNPADDDIKPGVKVHYRATGYDQFNLALTLQPGFTWNATGGGTIGATGVYTAGTALGGPFQVSAQSGAFSGTASVTIDAAPTVTITNPASGSVFSAPAALTLTTDAMDVDESVAKVVFYQNNASIGTATSAPFNFSVSNLAPGTYSFKATATDADDLSTTSKTISIVVNDTTPPSLTLPGNVVAEATGPTGAIVMYPQATATDDYSTPTIMYTAPSGSLFPLGVTTVTVTATDAANNTSTGTFTVTVQDTTPPFVSVPADITVYNTDGIGNVVSYAPATATDAVTLNPTIYYNFASGSLFPLGTTTVTAYAADAAGNVGSASFNVNVVYAFLYPGEFAADGNFIELFGPGNNSVGTYTTNSSSTLFSVSAVDSVNDAVTFTWAEISGPAPVTFSDNASTTAGIDTVTYTQNGTYVVSMTMSNTVGLSSTSTITITVNLAVNQPPVVSAGADQLISLPTNAVTLNGTATDDGLPNPPGALTLSWSVLSAPGTVVFADASAASTTATFSQSGVYVLCLTANDSVASSSSIVTITVNQPPTVYGAPDQSITLPVNTVAIACMATDDGIPNPPGALTLNWNLTIGPGPVTFSNPNSASTTATFAQAGIYVLTFSANDSVATSSTNVTVTVNPDVPPPGITNLAPADGSVVDTVQPIISANFVDNGGGIDYDTISFDVQFPIDFITGDMTAIYALPDPALAPGTYTVNLSVADFAGNTSTAHWQFVVPEGAGGGGTGLGPVLPFGDGIVSPGYIPPGSTTFIDPPPQGATQELWPPNDNHFYNPISITDLSFSQDLQMTDDLGTPYAAPQWKTGIQPYPPALNCPIGYAAGTTLKIAGTFHSNFIAPFTYLQIQGFGPAGINIPATIVMVDANYNITFPPTEAIIPFPATTVNYYPTFDISWQFLALNYGPAWVPLDTSRHTVYVTLGSPITMSRQRTVFHLGCSICIGDTDPEVIFPQIWGTFVSKVVQKYDGTPATGMTFQGQGTVNGTTASLLINANETCGGWANFMQDCLAIHGIPATRQLIQPTTWGAGPFFTFLPNTIIVKGIPAQGDLAPKRNQFPDHALVQYNDPNIVYDPSYGVSFPTLLDWQSASLVCVSWLEPPSPLVMPPKMFDPKNPGWSGMPNFFWKSGVELKASLWVTPSLLP